MDRGPADDDCIRDSLSDQLLAGRPGLLDDVVGSGDEDRVGEDLLQSLLVSLGMQPREERGRLGLTRCRCFLGGHELSALLIPRAGESDLLLKLQCLAGVGEGETLGLLGLDEGNLQFSLLPLKVELELLAGELDQLDLI